VCKLFCVNINKKLPDENGAPVQQSKVLPPEAAYNPPAPSLNPNQLWTTVSTATSRSSACTIPSATASATYGVATISRLLKITGLFCRISSLLWSSFAKETYNLKEPTNRSHLLSHTHTLTLTHPHTPTHTTAHSHPHTRTFTPTHVHVHTPVEGTERWCLQAYECVCTRVGMYVYLYV